MNVVIPWRAGCPHRERSLRWVVAQWEALGATVLIGEHADGPWCKAAAVANAIGRASDGPLAIADADVFPEDPAAITAAVAALSGHAWAVPHLYVHRLNEEASAAVIDGGPLPVRTFAEKPYHGFAGGGITITTKATYLQAPLDPRFTGWGQEDLSWSLALATLFGEPWRDTKVPLLHLWHPPQERQSRTVGSPDNLRLQKRYRAAHHRPDRMRALIEEAA